MYTAFYKLTGKPFQISSDPSFIWLGEKHREALATLKYGVIDNKGLMLLTGDVGTGKTTLINTLIESLSDDVYCASVPDPQLNLIDFLNYIAQAFHIDNDFKSKGSFLLHFGWFLESVYKQNKKVLLVIDEAQLLTQTLLEEIRLLSNIHRDGNHLLNIFFVGQNEFNEILHRPENRAVTQRITLNYQINPLSTKETDLYIRHRLKIAGASRMLFSTSAVKAISAYSEGIPRRINIICDHCLLTGYVEEKTKIDAKIVKDCVKDIAIPHYNKSPRTSEPHESQTHAPVKAQNAVDTPPRSKGRKTAFILIPVLVVSIIIAALFIPSLQVQKKVISTYHDAMEYLSSQTPSNQIKTTPADHQPDQVTTKNTSDNSVDKVEDDDLPSNLEAQENTMPVNVQESSTPIETDVKVHEPETLNPPELVLQIPIPEQPALEQKHSPLGQSEMPAPTPTPALPEGKIVISFESDSNDFFTSRLDQLTQLALSIKNRHTVFLNISGYTDSVGSERYNTRLSIFRANMIKSYLLGQGVRPQQLKVQGLGSRNPIADNATEEGRRLNRRVEIEVVKP